jgi:hypothetical protein
MVLQAPLSVLGLILVYTPSIRKTICAFTPVWQLVVGLFSLEAGLHVDFNEKKMQWSKLQSLSSIPRIGLAAGVVVPSVYVAIKSPFRNGTYSEHHD